MKDIFFSYASEDKARLAKPLVTAIREFGWSVWWDHDMTLRADEIFAKRLSRQIKEAKCCVVLWTPTSIEKPFVYSEATEALNQQKLVQLVMGTAVEDLPLPFNSLQAADMTDWNPVPEHDGFRKLIEILITLCGKSDKLLLDDTYTKSETWEPASLPEQIRSKAVKDEPSGPMLSVRVPKAKPAPRRTAADPGPITSRTRTTGFRLK